MKTQSGFTLIELMVTLAVGIIILAIGVPAFMNMMSSNQAAGYANDLVGAMRLARSEAVKRATTVAICASNATQTACSGNNWNNGWVVFADANANGNLEAGETIYRIWSIHVDERAELEFEATSPGSVIFDSSGGNVADVTVSFAFKKSDCHGNQARQINITPMGRPTLTHVACF